MFLICVEKNKHTAPI